MVLSPTGACLSLQATAIATRGMDHSEAEEGVKFKCAGSVGARPLEYEVRGRRLLRLVKKAANQGGVLGLNIQYSSGERRPFWDLIHLHHVCGKRVVERLTRVVRFSQPGLPLRIGWDWAVGQLSKLARRRQW